MGLEKLKLNDTHRASGMVTVKVIKKEPVSLGLVRFLCKFWIWLGFCHSYRGVINATNYQIKVQRY